MTIDDIRTMIVSDESRILELKKTTGELKDGMHSACAFLNTEGGWLIFGVTPKSLKIVGQEVTDNTQREIALALAGLEQDDRDQNQRGDQLQNCNKNNHQVFPPTYLLPHGHKIHIVDLILPQRGADCKHKSRPAGEFAGIFPVGGIEFP